MKQRRPGTPGHRAPETRDPRSEIRGHVANASVSRSECREMEGVFSSKRKDNWRQERAWRQGAFAKLGVGVYMLGAPPAYFQEYSWIALDNVR